MPFDEDSYVRGSRAAWRAMLGECLRQLGVDDPEAGKARWVTERADAVAMLRMVCDEHGDNDWESQFYLSDVIEKHLWNHLS